MAGHSKWSQIKRQKGTSDIKRSQLFSKLSRLISTQVKLAKGDVTVASVRAVIEKAKEANMPAETIERAIKKASEQKELEGITYEAYGPGGVALLIEVLTDNRNRAAQEIKFILSKNGFTLAAIGAVRWIFEKKEHSWLPLHLVELSDTDVALLETLVDDLEANDDVQEVVTNAN